MHSPPSLLRWSRSRYHPWFLRGATFGGGAMALAVALAAVVAATHPKPHHPSAWWTAGLVAVVALAALGVIALAVGSVGAFLARPVRDNHADELRASAQVAKRGLTSGFCGYGDDPDASKPKPRQSAFCAHFPRLAARLSAWDEVREAAAEAQRLLGVAIDDLMAAHEIADGFNVDRIRGYMRGLAMERAHGRLHELPAIEWGWTTTAVEPGDLEIPGARVGGLGPDASTDWISLVPFDGETRAEWRGRAEPLIERFEAFRLTAWENTVSEAQVARDAAARVTVFQHDELPAVGRALDLVQKREAPRVRRKCEAC